MGKLLKNKRMIFGIGVLVGILVIGEIITAITENTKKTATNEIATNEIATNETVSNGIVTEQTNEIAKETESETTTNDSSEEQTEINYTEKEIVENFIIGMSANMRVMNELSNRRVQTGVDAYVLSQKILLEELNKFKMPDDSDIIHAQGSYIVTARVYSKTLLDAVKSGDNPSVYASGAFASLLNSISDLYNEIDRLEETYGLDDIVFSDETDAEIERLINLIDSQLE